MDIIGFIGFLAASNIAFSNFKKTREISNLWLLVTISLTLVSITILLYALENYFQSLSDIINMMRDLFLLIAATLLFSTLISYQKENVLMKDCLDGNLKKRDGKRCEEIKEWLKTI